MTHVGDGHGALMDDVYRYQRLFYDVTRKYYLLGRDRLIEQIDAGPDDTILEVACGTGRNLFAVGRRYPKAKLYGFDISEQMLITARAKLGDRATLAHGDACNYDPRTLFGVEKFDHIVLSYSLSMIPDWQGAVSESLRHLAPGGCLHIVDFSGQERLPKWFKSALETWLAKFHVAPRPLKEALRDLGEFSVSYESLYRDYAHHARVTFP